MNPTWSQFVNWSTNVDTAKSISNVFLLQTMLLSKKPLESLIFFVSRILFMKSSLLDLTSNMYAPTDLFFCRDTNKISRLPTFCGHSSSLTPQVVGGHGNSSIMYRVVTLVTEKRISTNSFDRWIRDNAVYEVHAVHIPSPTCSFCHSYISSWVLDKSLGETTRLVLDKWTQPLRATRGEWKLFYKRIPMYNVCQDFFLFYADYNLPAAIWFVLRSFFYFM